jgi:putative endonuclease
MQILARCARTAAGEIDLVAYDQSTIVFVEVKARRVGARAPTERDPLESIGPRKRARLRRAGAAWLSAHRDRPRARRIRFDAIGVTIDGVGRVRALEHVCDAF